MPAPDQPDPTTSTLSTHHPAGPSNGTARVAPVPIAAGIFPVSSIQTMAESVGITNLDDSVAVALTADVEFRLHQVIEEAQKFMRHSKRSTMLPCDINHALQALNIEPLYGHLPIPSASRPTFAPLRIPGDSSSSNKSKSSSANLSSFVNGSSSDQQFYFLQDQEINFQSLLKEKPPGLVGGGVRWTAHWLAVEGVMPRVPENVAPVRQNPALTGGGSRAAGAGNQGARGVPGGALQSKPNLSQELQLYYSRLTKALLPDSAGAAAGGGELSSVERARLAALASLRGDTGLQGLVVYLVRWIGEKVTQSLSDLKPLSYLLDTIHALLSNQTLFLEPYLHQLLPPLLSPLLTYPLGSSSQPQINGHAFTDPSSSSSSPSDLTPSLIRQQASDTLAALAQEFGSVYESLIPRLSKTLLRSLSPPSPPGRVEGALLGLGALGRDAVKRGIWGDHGEGLKGWADGWERIWSKEEVEAVVRAGVSTLNQLLPNPNRPPTYSYTAPLSLPTEAHQALFDRFGTTFAIEISNDAWLSLELLKLVNRSPSSSSELSSSNHHPEPSSSSSHSHEPSSQPIVYDNHPEPDQLDAGHPLHQAFDQSHIESSLAAAALAAGVDLNVAMGLSFGEDSFSHGDDHGIPHAEAGDEFVKAMGLEGLGALVAGGSTGEAAERAKEGGQAGGAEGGEGQVEVEDRDLLPAEEGQDQEAVSTAEAVASLFGGSEAVTALGEASVNPVPAPGEGAPPAGADESAGAVGDDVAEDAAQDDLMDQDEDDEDMEEVA